MLPKLILAAPIDLTVTYVLHTGVGAIVWWLERDQLCSPEQMAVWLYPLSIANTGVSVGSGR
jgi:hypothetical protein